MDKVDIKEVLAQYMPMISETLEYWIPRKWNEKDLINITGMQRYKCHVESLNKTTSEPMWDLLDRGICKI